MPLDQKQYPAVIEPSQDVASLQQALARLNEIVGMLTGQRGGAEWSLAAGLRSVEKVSNAGISRILELTEVQDNLAARTDIVEVRSNNATANGTIQIKALTTPLGGATASYNWQLTANSNSIGMTASVDNTGVGSIAFTAGKFLIYDPSFNSGTPVPVFSYSAGKFVMQGDVSINGSLLVNDTVTNSKIGAQAVTNSAFNRVGASANPTASVSLTVRDSARVMVVGNFLPSGGGTTTTPNAVARILLDGVIQAETAGNYIVASVTTNVSGSAGTFTGVVNQAAGTTSLIWHFSGMAAGTYSFSFSESGNGVTGYAQVIALELADN